MAAWFIFRKAQWGWKAIRREHWWFLYPTYYFICKYWYCFALLLSQMMVHLWELLMVHSTLGEFDTKPSFLQKILGLKYSVVYHSALFGISLIMLPNLSESETKHSTVGPDELYRIATLLCETFTELHMGRCLWCTCALCNDSSCKARELSC